MARVMPNPATSPPRAQPQGGLLVHFLVVCVRDYCTKPSAIVLVMAHDAPQANVVCGGRVGGDRAQWSLWEEKTKLVGRCPVHRPPAESTDWRLFKFHPPPIAALPDKLCN